MEYENREASVSQTVGKNMIEKAAPPVQPWTKSQLKASIQSLKFDQRCIKCLRQTTERLQAMAILQAEIDKLEAELTQMEATA